MTENTVSLRPGASKAQVVLCFIHGFWDLTWVQNQTHVITVADLPFMSVVFVVRVCVSVSVRLSGCGQPAIKQKV